MKKVPLVITLLFLMTFVSAGFGYDITKNGQGVTITINDGAGGGAGNLSATSGPYLYDDTTTVYFNETKLNQTIALESASASDTNESTRFNTLVGTDCGAGDYVYGVGVNGLLACSTPAGGSGDNSSWNQSFAETLFAPILFGADWNKTYADTLYAPIGAGSDNSSWNESYANTLYADIQWGYNMTDPFTNWLATFVYNYNQSLATYNMWDSRWLDGNVSFNQSLTDSLYAPIGVGSDNSSWNESYANTKYAGIQWGYNQSLATYNMWNAGWLSTYNATYAGYAPWTTIFNTTGDARWGGSGSSYNATYDATTKQWNGNFSRFNGAVNNASYLSTYNATYHATTQQWNGNFSRLNGAVNNASYLSTYNATYAGLINNASYLSTYNATYDAKISFVNTNIAYVNNSNTFTQPQIISNNLNATNITIGGCTSVWNGTCKIETCPTTKFIQC